MSFFWTSKWKEFEEEAKESYLMGFRDGRLCPFGRPCEVDGKPCLFHRWVDEDKAVLEIGPLVKQDTLDVWRRAFDEFGDVPPHSTVKILRHTYALVEYPDGSVGKVEPELVQFLDRKED